MQINVHEAKTHFSKLLMRVKKGEEVIIAKAGEPIARLVPVTDHLVRRVPGSAKGKITVTPGFEDPLPESLIKDFER
ncbi:MAG: type II toxin-antitoxin system Phd/YefM family antitoxin [Bacillota bacterium]